MSKINKITPLTNVKFLNLYELEAENKFGDTHPYYVASRKNENIMMAATKEVIPDGVVIYSLFGEKAGMARILWQKFLGHARTRKAGCGDFARPSLPLGRGRLAGAESLRLREGPCT